LNVYEDQKNQRHRITRARQDKALCLQDGQGSRKRPQHTQRKRQTHHAQQR
jgi:hypothetical protein